MFFIRYIFLASAMTLFIHTAVAQVSPPGMDNTNAVGWGAAAISQQIGRKWSLTVYVGAARESNPDNWSLIQKPAIFVFNQETKYHFNKQWQLSFCASFRKQNRYIKEKPFTPGDPSLREELRYYTRLYYKRSIGQTRVTCSLRPELRYFYNPQWHRWQSGPEEIRLRFKVQANTPLNEQKTNQFILANEWLTATDEKRKDNNELYWTTYHFTEDRLSMYFRHQFKNPSIIFDIGFLHQFKVDESKVDYILHLAVDIIWQNPFGIPNT